MPVSRQQIPGKPKTGPRIYLQPPPAMFLRRSRKRNKRIGIGRSTSPRTTKGKCCPIATTTRGGSCLHQQGPQSTDPWTGKASLSPGSFPSTAALAAVALERCPSLWNRHPDLCPRLLLPVPPSAFQRLQWRPRPLSKRPLL